MPTLIQRRSFVLHRSLIDLAQQAPKCSNPATVRGVLAESQDLLRNAIDHNEPPQQLVIWFSRLVTDVLHSQGVQELTGGARVVLTGPVGRGDALPSSPITWLTVGDASADTTNLVSLLKDVGLLPEVTMLGAGARSQVEWIEAIHAANSNQLAVFADAGTWCLQEVLALEHPQPLLREALKHRPPKIRLASGLPDREVSIDFRRNLLYPIIALARWAGVAAHSHEFSTPRRLADAQAAQILSEQQVDALLTAWEAGLKLQFRRFAARVHNHPTTIGDLSAIDRSTFGASTRLVSEVMYAVAAQNGIELAR